MRRTSVNRFFYMLFCLSLALTFYFHKDSTSFCDSKELWSDRAGYYIYLPAVFYYHFDTRKMPADLDVQTGGGFGIDTVHNKIDTKYTYGIALLESPFFIASAVISRLAGYDSENGFSLVFMRMMSLAAVVYLILGLWFLKRFLDHYFSPGVNLAVITLIFLATNLFYYALIDGMMSHVYSFFLFALFLFALKRYLMTRQYSWFIVLCIALSVATLIRPTNILPGLLFFTWDAASPAEWGKRSRQVMQPKYLLVFFVMMFIVFLPQLAYWKYFSGHWIHFSYRDEGFINWRNPRIAEVLFSPVNGLFTYTPLAFAFLAGITGMIIRKKRNGWALAAVFIVVTLVCASWKMWYFGCSYGQRSFIEYYAILAFPLAWFITGMMNTRHFLAKTAMMFVLLLFVYANLRYVIVLYRHDRCYYGSTWDWDHYKRAFERAGVISPVHRIRSFKNDFENLAICPVRHPSTVFTHSGQYSIAANGQNGQTSVWSVRLEELGYPYPKRMEVEVWMINPGARPSFASLGYSLNRGEAVIFGDSQLVDDSMKDPLTWSKVRQSFIIPDVNDSSLMINLFIENKRGSCLFADDLTISFHYGWGR